MFEKLSDTYRHHGEGWPRSPKGLSEALKRQAPALYSLGIDVIQSTQRETTETGRGLTVKILKTGNIGNVGNIVSEKTAGESFLTPKISHIAADKERF